MRTLISPWEVVQSVPRDFLYYLMYSFSNYLAIRSSITSQYRGKLSLLLIIDWSARIHYDISIVVSRENSVVCGRAKVWKPDFALCTFAFCSGGNCKYCSSLIYELWIQDCNRAVCIQRVSWLSAISIFKWRINVFCNLEPSANVSLHIKILLKSRCRASSSGRNFGTDWT